MHFSGPLDRSPDDVWGVVLAALSGPPGPDSAWALNEVLQAEVEASVRPGPGPRAVVTAGVRAQVFCAQERLSGWSTYTRLAQAALWLQEWTARPPINSALPDDPVPSGDGSSTEESVAGVALRRRLERVESEWLRRHHRLFGFPGSYADWLDAVVPRLVASELAVAAGVSPVTAHTMVAAAEALFVEERLPLLRRLLAAGWVDWPKVRLFVRSTSPLDGEVALAVEALVIGRLPDPDVLAGVEIVDVLADPSAPGSGVPVIARWTLGQLQDALTAAVLALDPQGAEDRARRARRGRHVRAVPSGDGVAEVTANVPAEDAAAVMTTLTDAAKTAKAAGDPRTFDQLRADEYVQRLLRPVASVTRLSADDSVDNPGVRDATHDGDVAAECGDGGEGTARCECGRRVPVRYVSSFTAASAGPVAKGTLVSLTMPLSTFLGIADDPGRLDGHGPIAADLARRIAADAGRAVGAGITWRCVVTDDVHGTVLGVGDPVWTPRHDPPPRLRRLVETSAPICVFPGCRTSARRCDVDHRIPYDPDDPDGERGGGRTCSCNLQPMCRTHHQQKTMGALRVRAVTGDPAVPAGTLEWTLPSGV
ncbi:MAG TPA: DUF222 domain-containing protein, partial [Kineosporiaceae bacterium]|nr:DUF222 domain-containing protein [Kineosporiaceae bacterium]